jgi:hypothetical protein
LLSSLSAYTFRQNRTLNAPIGIREIAIKHAMKIPIAKIEGAVYVSTKRNLVP